MNSAACEQNAPSSNVTTSTTAAVAVSTEKTKDNKTSESQSSSSPSSSNTEPKSSSAAETLPEFHWVVRPCFLYDEEYSDCRSFKARFHQYFIHGESTDCSQWKTDYTNCTLWEKKQDQEALEKVIDSEKARIRTRLRGHYANDVWENRKEPPQDWNKELPKEILDEYANSYLKERADAIKEGKETLGSVEKNIREGGLFDPEEVSRCVIV